MAAHPREATSRGARRQARHQRPGAADEYVAHLAEDMVGQGADTGTAEEAMEGEDEYLQRVDLF